MNMTATTTITYRKDSLYRPLLSTLVGLDDVYPLVLSALPNEFYHLTPAQEEPAWKAMYDAAMRGERNPARLAKIGMAAIKGPASTSPRR